MQHTDAVSVFSENIPTEFAARLKSNAYRLNYSCFIRAEYLLHQILFRKGMNSLNRLILMENPPNEDEQSVLPIVLDLSVAIDFIGTLTIEHWNKGITWTLAINSTSETFSYLEQELVPLSFLLCQENIYQEKCMEWYLAIPKEVRINLAPYQTHEFAILYLVSHFRYAYELFVSHPTLFWLMLCTAKDGNFPENKVLALMGKPRKEILQFCGLPPTNSVLKLISKLKFSRFDEVSLENIRLINKIENYAQLNHLNQIGSIVLPLVHKFPELVNSHLITNVCLNNNQYAIEEIGETINDIKQMATTMRVTNIVVRIRQCGSFDDVEVLHNNLVARLNVMNFNGVMNIDYEEPPIPGNTFILPIINTESLFSEGVEQNHCVFSYHDEIVAGRYYVYKIIEPERATLGLFLDVGKQPEIDQLYLAGNLDVSPETRKTVMEWLNNY